LTALANALDLPDEPPRAWRSPASAAVAAALWLAIGTVLCRTFALGGWERPRVAVGLVLAAPAAIVAWLLVGAHPRRTLITAVAMLVGLLVIPLASAGATPSPARLRQIADAIGVPGKVVHEVQIGNGRCRPACSELRRTSVASGSSYVKYRAQIEGALTARGFEIKRYARRAGEPDRIDAVSERLLVSVDMRMLDLSRTRIAQIYIARGPKPDHSVG
jgi:hypothetical protein